MKAMWETPRVAVERFAPNDYVAACFKLGCGAGEQGTTLPSGYSKTDLWGDYGKYQSVNTGTYWNPNWKNQVTVDGTTYTVEMDHSGDCKNEDKNAIQVNGNNVSIWEQNSQQGTLDTIITRSEDFDNNGWEQGDLFAWITFGLTNGLRDGRIWLHWAFAGIADRMHPNRS